MEAAKKLFALLITTAIFVSQASAQSFYTNGLVAYYPFNGNANDESGYGNDLTNYGGATLCPDRFGNTNQAYAFDGGSFLGSSAPPPPLLNQIDDWTVSAWIKPTSLTQSTAYAVCVGYDNDKSGDGFAMGISGGDQIWAFFPGVGFDLGDDEFSFTNEWYSVVMSRNSGTTTFYINGDPLTNIASILTAPSSPPSSIVVGAGGFDSIFGYGTVACGFAGAVDDVRVYNRFLSALEISEMYFADHGSPPQILSQPTNYIVDIDGDAEFGVVAFKQNSSVLTTYQWTLNDTNLVGETNSELIFTNVQPIQAGAYYVIVSNVFGTVISSNAFLTVLTLPIIVSEPQNQISLIGETALLSAAATGPIPMFFQWEYNGTNIDQATNSTLLLTNVQPMQGGSYTFIASNLYGTATSSNAVLSVLPLAAFVTNGLVAYYPFRGNANDESGYGNDLTNHGATLCPDRFGTPNQAYLFDGTTYLESTNPPLQQIDNWTMMAWIQPRYFGQSTAFAVCAGYDNGSAGDGFGMGINDGNQLWAFFPSMGYVYGGYEFSSNIQWTHLVMVQSSGMTEFYVNGELVTNDSPILATPKEPTSFEVGSSGGAFFFTGEVDDVRVYNRALVSSEIQEIYSNETNPPSFIKDPGIISQPQSLAVLPGGTSEFSVSASGAALNYQWLLNGGVLPGQTGSTFIVTNSTSANEGQYWVIISNAVGVVTSTPAALNIQAGAAFLNPVAFLSLGTFNPSNDVVIDASTGQMSGGATFAGVLVTNAGLGTYVFNFSSFTLQSNVNLTVTNSGSGADAIALLSQSDMNVSGTIDASASSASASNCGAGAGGAGGYGHAARSYGGGGGGGGFGGDGGFGDDGGSGAAPGTGGGTYNPDITAQLADGSCGAPGGNFGGYGGDGGGAIQLAAYGTLTISGTVLADGANGTKPQPGDCLDPSQGSGGGGSGGAILIRANNVAIDSSASLLAEGGDGGPGGLLSPGVLDCYTGATPGGGGGGGRIVVDYVSAGANSGLITAYGGTGGGTDGTVFFGQNPMVLTFPNIAISQNDSKSFVLSWPVTATNYTLQTSPALGVDSVWTPAPAGIEVGGSMVLTNQASGSGAFFRLKHN